MTMEENRCKEELAILGLAIYDARKKAKLTQEQLGSLCSLHTNQVGKLEQGADNLDMKTLVKASFTATLPLFQHYKLAASAITHKKPIAESTINNRLKRVLKRIGKGILQMLKSKGIKQEHLAFLLEMDKSEINKYIHGRINIQYLTLVRIAVKLEVTTAELLA